MSVNSMARAGRHFYDPMQTFLSEFVDGRALYPDGGEK